MRSAMKSSLSALVIGAALAGPALGQGAPASPAAEPPAPAAFLSVAPADLMVSNLIDLTVYNAQNQRIGEVEDLVLDGARGVRAVIVSVGTYLGTAERHVAVDPASLQLIRAANGSYRAVLNATAEQVRAAPELKYRGAWSE